MSKNILNLTTDELKQILDTGAFPDDVNWDNLETRPDFIKLFRFRQNPAKFAKYLLNERGEQTGAAKAHSGYKHTYVPGISVEMRQKRLELKERELLLQADKQKIQTQLWEKVLTIAEDVAEIKKIVKRIQRGE